MHHTIPSKFRWRCNRFIKSIPVDGDRIYFRFKHDLKTNMWLFSQFEANIFYSFKKFSLPKYINSDSHKFLTLYEVIKMWCNLEDYIEELVRLLDMCRFIYTFQLEK